MLHMDKQQMLLRLYKSVIFKSKIAPHDEKSTPFKHDVSNTDDGR